MAGAVGAWPAVRRGGPYSTPVELRWLGVSGWEIVIGGGRSVLTVRDETVRYLLMSTGTPRARIDDVIQVKGGEYLQFDGYTVEVFRSLHSQPADHGYFAPGRRVAPPRRPTVLGDLVEGDTLAQQVSVDGGPRILLMGASKFVERELAGIRPDVALVPMSSHSAVHRYVERFLTATGNPLLLIPSHHDDMAPLPTSLAFSWLGPILGCRRTVQGVRTRLACPHPPAPAAAGPHRRALLISRTAARRCRSERRAPKYSLGGMDRVVKYSQDDLVARSPLTEEHVGTRDEPGRAV